jgi:hypothetical protein
LHAFAAEADLIQQLGDVFDSALCGDITFQVMAIPWQSTGDHYAVNPPLKGVEHLHHVQLAGAGNFDDPHIRGVLESHGPGQVGGGVGAMVTAEGHNLRLKTVYFTHHTLLVTSRR